jgi:hypothetical protein
MFRTLFIICITGLAALYFTDIDGASLVHSVVLPFVVLASLIAFAVWLVLFVHRAGLEKAGGEQKVENNATITPDDLGGFGGDGNGG